MMMKDLMGIVTRDKKKQARTKAATQIAVGVGAVVIAAASGVATGILIAPKPGKETLDDLKQTCIHGMARKTCSACEGGKPE